MLDEVIHELQIQKGKKYIDATAGEGGHTEAIIKRGGIVLALDRSKHQVEKLKRKFSSQMNISIVQGNFADMKKIAEETGFNQVHGILFDLGLSYEQLKKGRMGLSYMHPDEPLDMRLDDSCAISAQEILNTYSEDQLYEIFSRNSEEIYSRNIAKAIVHKRKHKLYEKVSDLVETIKKVVWKSNTMTLARIFQALRMQVNNEIENLHRGLNDSKSLLEPKGKVLIISFHSLEDRIVKKFAQKHSYRPGKSKMIKAGNDGFSFERSAKLRVIET